MRRHARVLFAVAALASFFAIAASASAATYSEVGVFANNGSGPGGSGYAGGQLTNPGQVAVDDATGMIYVANTSVNRLEGFQQTPAGGQLTAIGNHGSAVTAPTGVAVDQSTADIYVANASGVLKYDSAFNQIVVGWSAPSATGTLAVDPSNGDLLVADRAANLIRRFESDGTPAGSFAAARPIGIAANSAGEIFAVTSTGDVNLDCAATSSVQRFSAAGTPEGTVGSLEAPGAVAVDPDDDSILVASPVNQYNCGSQRPKVSFFDAAGSFVESVELGAKTLYATIPGLVARGDGSSRVYAVSKSPQNDAKGATSITAIAIPPSGTLDPVSPATITASGAELTGTVNPGGKDTHWHFEYRRATTTAWSSTPEEDAGSGTTSVPVSATIDGLQANATYEVRLYVASADGGPVIAPVSFKTVAIAPTVATHPATQLEVDSALLRGAVNANNQATTFYFEYGESTDYGSSVPSTEDASAGAAGEPKTVAITAQRLSPSTTYHFRIAATNATGTSYGDDRTFTTAPVPPPCPNAGFRTGPSATLPDCRAYEQVSPVDKNGNSVLVSVGRTLALPGWSSPNGDAALYNPSAGAAVPDPARGFNFPQVSERTASGWVSRPAANGPAPQAPVAGTFSTLSGQLPSADRKSLLFVSGSSFTLDNPYMPGSNGLLSTGVNIGRGALVEWISKPTWSGAFPQAGQLPLTGLWVAGASEDLSSAFFTTYGTLTPEDEASGRVPVQLVNEPGATDALYRWHEGQLSNAGVLPDGTLDPQGSQMAGNVAAAGNSQFNSGVSDMYGSSHPVTADGSSWLFVSPDPSAETGRPTQLYLGRDGQPSVLLSTEAGQSAPIAGSAGVFRAGARDGGGNDSSGPNLPGSYAMRSKDGRFVLFTTIDALAAGAPAGGSEKTYRYDLAQQTLTYLPELTFTSTVGLGNALGPVLNMSDDGSRILYRNPDTGVLGIWREDAAPIVLSPTPSGSAPFIDSRFSSDGQTIVLTSKVALREEADHPADQIEIYRYTEAGDELECISCPPPGVTLRSTALFSPLGITANSPSEGSFFFPLERMRGVSADGKRVFFQTTSPLTSQDHNTVSDVYEWRENALWLISGGRSGAAGSFIVDNDANGDNAFFVTKEGLVPEDTDGAYDLYDARVGGGFAPPSPPPPGCAGSACQGEASS
ncbi:MAG: hypothetical protein WA862_12150, partial [Solirubrobacterales bacterium]